LRYKGKFYNRFKTVQRPPRVCPLGQGQGPTIGQTIQGQGRGPPVGPSIGQAVQAGPSTNPSVHSGLMHLDIHSHPTNLPMQSPLIQGLSINSPLQGPGHPAISPVQGPSQAVQGLPTNLPVQGQRQGPSIGQPVQGYSANLPLQGLSGINPQLQGQGHPSIFLLRAR
jgi:hypothetical protein